MNFDKLIQELRNDVNALSLLSDWLGDGANPVSQREADCRAIICENCHQNKEPNWWDRVKSSIATVIKAQIELKNRGQLRAVDEEKLSMCAACGCCIRLKVWTPIKHIREHLTQAQFDKTTPFCWMRKELKESDEL